MQWQWTWVWGDHGDEIISSHQQFPTKQLCLLDGLRHQPMMRSPELNGRSVGPRLEVKATPVLEYRWIFSLYNNNSERVATVEDDTWYDSWAVCLNKGQTVTGDVDDKSAYWEIDFEAREKKVGFIILNLTYHPNIQLFIILF